MESRKVPAWRQGGEQLIQKDSSMASSLPEQSYFIQSTKQNKVKY